MDEGLYLQPSLFHSHNDTDHKEDSPVSNNFSTTLGAVILGLVFLLGVPGNLFVIWSILARTRRRSITTILILNLAFADGILMALTIFFIIYLAKRTWIFGLFMCKCLFYLCNSNMYASIFLITLMSLHRLVSVVFPSRVSSLASRRIVRRLIVGMWVLVMVISLPSLLFRGVTTNTAEKNFTRMVCAPKHTLSRNVRFQYTLETVAGFILPYALIITSYALIMRRLRQTKFGRKIRSEKLILAIVVTFGIFWLPYHVVNMIQVAAEWYPQDSPTKERLDHISQACRAVTSALAFISSCANPVLYTFTAKSYIKRDGFAFMAKLFEATLDQIGNKKGRVMGKDSVGTINVDLIATRDSSR
nr:leukotriene B4 receptor 1-like [Monopterus albus]